LSGFDLPVHRNDGIGAGKVGSHEVGASASARSSSTVPRMFRGVTEGGPCGLNVAGHARVHAGGPDGGSELGG